MTYMLPQAEREMDRASQAKDKRIAELEAALQDTRADIMPCPMDEHCETSYLCRGDTCPYCQSLQSKRLMPR